MAKGGAGDMTDVSDWCDIKMLECAFKREVKKGEGTLTEIRKVIGPDKEVHHNMDVSYAGQCDNKPAKKMSFAKFKTKDWFMAMTNKKEAKAQALAKKIVEAEKAKQETEAKKGPAKKGSDVTSRLTDASKYTGAHKERFDADGKGKGIEGRESRTKNTGYTGDYKGEDTYDKGGKKSGSAADDITKRLTDTKLYTGAHKERFDDSGKGKGSSGRVDQADSSGYVGNYKGKGTYDKK